MEVVMFMCMMHEKYSKSLVMHISRHHNNENM